LAVDPGAMQTNLGWQVQNPTGIWLLVSRLNRRRWRWWTRDFFVSSRSRRSSRRASIHSSHSSLPKRVKRPGTLCWFRP